MNREEQAVTYMSQGLSVIPLKPKDKKPLIEWTKYQEKAENDPDVISQWFKEWPEANIGIVTGKVSRINVIDVDSEEAMELVHQKGMPVGPMVKTGKGYHIYCKYREGVRNFQTRADLPGIDLRAEGGYVVAPPSVHESGRVYQWVEGQEFESLNLQELPDWLLAKNESEKTPLVEIYKGVAKGGRNMSLARLVGSWANDGLSFEECLEMAVLWNSKNNPPEGDKNKIHKTVKSIFNKHHKEKEQANSESKPQFTAYFPGLVDIVEFEGQPAFLYKLEGKLLVAYKVNIGDTCYIPPPAGAITWLLPRVDEVLKYYKNDNNKKLYSDLYTYHKSISELPSEGHYDLLVAWDFHTYLLEQFRYSPYLYFFAVAERGKSRTGKSICYVAYRGFRTEAVNESQIIRLSNNYKVTLFLDMRDLWKVAEKKSIQDILLGRFEKGSQVPRVLYPEKGAFLDMVYFDVFGPTIIATNVKVDEILETRAVEINMPETDKNFENDVTPENALPLKERLVAFRARHLDEKLQHVKKSVKGRLGDILRPIHQTILLVNPDKEVEFIKFIAKLESQRKIERSMSIEAEILTAIAVLENSVQGGKLSVDDICKKMNQSRPEKSHVNSYRTGKKITAMGFERGRMNDGKAAIIYDDKIINRLLNRYGIEKTSEDSDLSE